MALSGDTHCATSGQGEPFTIKGGKMKVTKTFRVLKPMEVTETFDLGKILNEWDLSKNRRDKAKESLGKVTEYAGVVIDMLLDEKLIEEEKAEVGYGSKDWFIHITEKGKDEMAKSRIGVL